MAEEALRIRFCKECCDKYDLGERCSFSSKRKENLSCDICHKPVAEVMHIYIGEIMENYLRYKEALERIHFWGNEWTSENSLPDNWPRTNGIAYTPDQIVRKALGKS